MLSGRISRAMFIVECNSRMYVVVGFVVVDVVVVVVVVVVVPGNCLLLEFCDRGSSLGAAEVTLRGIISYVWYYWVLRTNALYRYSNSRISPTLHTSYGRGYAAYIGG